MARAFASGEARKFTRVSFAAESGLLKSIQPGAAFRSATCAAGRITRLFVELAATHFLLDSSMLNELPKPLHCILNFLPISKTKLDHNRSFRVSCA